MGARTGGKKSYESQSIFDEKKTSVNGIQNIIGKQTGP